jgi:hypothetical protein
VTGIISLPHRDPKDTVHSGKQNIVRFGNKHNPFDVISYMCKFLRAGYTHEVAASKQESLPMRYIFTLCLLLAIGIFGVSAQADEVGTLTFRANGEGFVREGFISKDGWNIDFNHVYVALTQIRAYQTNPPYDAFAGELTRSNAMVGLAGDYIIDLAAGDEDADPIVVGVVEAAPAGYYNAVSWTIAPADGGDSEGFALLIDGTATKDGETVAFMIRIENTYNYTCGAFVGDERKGVLAAGSAGEVEMTFHFDHIFGDADTPLDDSLNTGAPGFAMFAALAADDRLDVTMGDLETSLAADDYQMLVDVLPSLGHVGEGHCHEY